MGLFQKIIDLVKEELLDGSKKPAKKQGNRKAPASKPKGDSFELLCTKAKEGDLVAQYKLYDLYADKADKRESLEELFTEMMNNGDVEGKGLLATLILKYPKIYPKERIDWANDMADEACNQGSLFVPFLNGIFYAHPKGFRRNWDAGINDNRFLMVPVNFQAAVSLLSQVKQKLDSCSKEEQAAFHIVYGFLALCLFYNSEYDNANKCALKGLDLKDALSCYVLALLCKQGWGGNDKNSNYVLLYLKKAEQYNIDSMGDDIALLYHSMVWEQAFREYEKAPSDEFVNLIKKHLFKAAELGSSVAMANLAGFYETGASKLGIIKDMEKALEWRNKAISAGVDINSYTAPFGSL